MTEKERDFLEIWFRDYVDRFRDSQGLLHPMLELKRSHSLRVAKNAKLIAVDLRLSEAEQRNAEVAGLIHDVGRFEQFERYLSFRDADTTDHGFEGYRILKAQEPPLVEDFTLWELLLCAVLHHNKRRIDLPSDISRGQEQLLWLVRDADKLDIMEIVLNSVASDGFRDFAVMLPNIRLTHDLSPEVLEEVQNTRSVSSDNLSTMADFLVMTASWFYDLNYIPTWRMAMDRDVLLRIRRLLPETRAVDKMFADIIDLMPID